MQPRRLSLALATAAAFLAACTGQVPAPSTGGAGPGGAASGPAAAITPNPASTATLPPGPGAGTAVAPPPGATGTITGTITFHMDTQRSDEIVHIVLHETLDFTVDVRLVRDPSGAEEVYVDDGSSYEVHVLFTSEAQAGDCMARTKTVADTSHAFADQPTSYENFIEAKVHRDRGVVDLTAMLSWMYDFSANDCSGRSPYTFETAVGFACPLLWLEAKLIEGGASDQIDTACTLPGGETYSGVLILSK